MLSIVIPAYNEEGNIKQLYLQLMKVLPTIGMTWEIIFCDDGSDDRTWEVIADLHRLDNFIRGIRLSRNFGHQYALYAGLSHARGNVIISMDADLQHPPLEIPKMLDEWQKGIKVVTTTRIEPNDFTFIKKLSSKVYYRLFSYLSGVRLGPGMSDFRLLDRMVLDSLLNISDEGLFIRGIIQWLGYPSSNIRYQCQDRFSGTTKYTLKKMINFAFSGIMSFSIVPLRLGIVLGILCSLFAFWQMADAIYVKVILKDSVPGWAQTMTVLSFMFGALFILLGIIGEYLGRILIEVRKRPRFIIEKFVGIDNE